MTNYLVAERFTSLEGEGLYTGVMMRFIRLAGCSVGKKVCQACDTDFDSALPWRGGGRFSDVELADWVDGYQHVELTGGEPLDHDVIPLCQAIWDKNEKTLMHVQTSGTKNLPGVPRDRVWICVSPKPGFREDIVMAADEVKVIVPGLGVITDALRERYRKDWSHLPGYTERLNDRRPETIKLIEAEREAAIRALRWPDLQDALRWAAEGKTVFLQPLNDKLTVDKMNLKYVLDVLRDHPELRLSCQLHKILGEQ
jgi:organic radical activating enzyme